jgi:LysR family transcriptional activator of nhaA
MFATLKGKTIWLNYHHLYYFFTVVNEGNLAKASQKLLIGQSTLSTQLRIFEETLGVQLFDRQKNKLELTESGRKAHSFAAQIFKTGEDMVSALETMES